MHLMALTYDWQLLVVILEVAFGLGMVIFVHELGHFLVAKWCGVKCEKFYLGFDIYGLKLAKYQWGETEYGIGILPLGGYVKMLGQDDNPSRAAAERERSTVHHHVPSGDLPHEPTSIEEERMAAALDPRSYLAKSVPQRMAIISAGVIMNVIFAFVMAAIAYGIGVRDEACGISAVIPGEAAWRADMHPGDKIVGINNSGDRPLRFRDLMNAVALCDLDEGINFHVQREGVAEPFVINVRPDPDTKRFRPTIGVINPRTTQLGEEKPTIPDTPAAATQAFEPGDRIVQVGDMPIKGYADLVAAFARQPDDALKVVVERNAANTETADGDSAEQDTAEKKTDEQNAATAESAAPQRVEINVPPRPMRTLGLVMKMGKITAVQDHSPAAAAGLREGDFITMVDGAPPGDPMRLPDVLRRRAGEKIVLGISRQGNAGEEQKLEKEVTLREPLWSDLSDGMLIANGAPVDVPALGIAYRVLNIVDKADKDSPAALAQLTKDGKPADVPVFASGDEIVQAEILLSDKAAAEAKDQGRESTSIKFGEDAPNWAFFTANLQWLPPGSKVKLTLADGRTTTIEPADAADWHLADRGLITTAASTVTKARSLGEALSLGGRETVDAVLHVYLFLRKLGSQISFKVLGGPKTIAEAAGRAAYDSVSQLLIFLTLLSANLAVVNFLPIPLLDGGHMVFLILEGILRRPVSERVQIAFHYVGFVFIISLMLFVLGLDFNVIPRQ
ncbi:MAG: site-2 protease family protein [Pirellulales bacterium]